MKYIIRQKAKMILADTLTPVNIYLKLRDVFACSILLESSEYRSRDNSLSLICCDPIAAFKVTGSVIETNFPDGESASAPITNLPLQLENFQSRFEVVGDAASGYPTSGLFGYISYDAVRHFEEVEISRKQESIPEVFYQLYRYVIVINHFSNEMVLAENVIENARTARYTLEQVQQMIYSNRFSTYHFSATDSEGSNMTDDDFQQAVQTGKQHCYRGDVFQIVLSRRFTRSFRGDEFNVYRALRSINPSPYLFYFDYGSFKVFGSSPEAQLRINQDTASLYPIAGTFRRSGNDAEDARIAARLSEDQKENAEHLMLVDLARNDMSRHASQVQVEVFKEVQYYSHVIHLVSKVSGKISGSTSTAQMVADTFPAGTLSGAPKHKAITLIDKLENVNREFYGGAIGYMGFDQTFNHAIMIRTFLSHRGSLTYQAGAGVVAQSDPQLELQEVNNKLGALRKAIATAEKLN